MTDFANTLSSALGIQRPLKLYQLEYSRTSEDHSETWVITARSHDLALKRSERILDDMVDDDGETIDESGFCVLRCYGPVSEDDMHDYTADYVGGRDLLINGTRNYPQWNDD